MGAAKFGGGYKVSEVSSLHNLLYKMAIGLTFEISSPVEVVALLPTLSYE